MVALILEWVFAVPLNANDDANHRKQLFGRVQQYLKRAPEAIIFMASPSVYKSYVIPGAEFILKKAVVASQPLGILEQCQGSVRFMCFSCAVSLSIGSNAVMLTSSTDEELFTVQDAARLFITRFIRGLRIKHQIQLMISTEALDESVIAVCTRQGIACVQLAEPEDVEALCIISGIFPLASLFDEIHDENHVGICANGISHVRFQQQACLRFRGLAGAAAQKKSRRFTCYLVPQVLVHAPSKGVFKQYYAGIVKCLRVLRSWWDPHDVEMQPESSRKSSASSESAVFSCRGGGATELAIARWLQTSRWSNASTLSSSAASMARQIIAEALIEVVSALRSSLSKACGGESNEEPASNQQDGRRRVLLEALSRLNIQDKDVSAQTLYGYVLNSDRTVDTVAGPIQIPELVFADPADYGLVHPWRRMDTLLFLVLQTLEQLFRLDLVLLAKAPSMPTSK